MCADFAAFVRRESDGKYALDLKVEGMKCVSCVTKVQEALKKPAGLQSHVDLASGRASLRWSGKPEQANDWAGQIEAVGYGVQPFEVETHHAHEMEEASYLLRCLIVAGVASALVMGWGMTAAPPVWIMATLTVIALLYSGRPFFASAFRAVRHGSANMDVPIALALVLTTGMSLFEIAHRGTYAYFDSVVMLLFILLIGRYLDQKTRGRARAAAADLLAMFSGKATIIGPEGQKTLPIRDLRPGMVLLVAAGEKIGADGVVTQGASEVDPSIITGETIAQPVGPGAKVFGGMVNLGAPLHVRVEAASGESLVGEVIKLMEKAEQAHAKFVRLADRVARLYTPGVFFLAALTFFGWWFGVGAPWQQALLVTSTVLIITCPCAMGLAVPAVQVIASSRLFRKGLLLKAADALERLSKVDTIVFDKTGTLTLGQPHLLNRADVTTEALKLAASLAAQSQHPLARAVVRAHGDGPVYALEVKETAGQGLEASHEGELVRLGRREWSGPAGASPDERPEMWLRIGYKPALRLVFEDAPRADAAEVIASLKKLGFDLYLLSGDRESVVAEIASRVGIDKARAHLSPMDKCAAIEALKAEKKGVLMVGDGLNDAAALATANVSMSPSSALDITQNAADIVFQGSKLSPVVEALLVARKAERLVRQNIGLSLLYNVIAVPVAMAGQASPLFAAAAMSLSSLIVVLNAQRAR